MTPDDLKGWRKLMGYKQGEAANALGYGRRQYQRMELGQEEIRRCVDLGCAALAIGLTEYDSAQIADIIKERKETTHGHNITIHCTGAVLRTHDDSGAPQA